MAKRKVKIDLILSSPARRATKTARIFADKLDYTLKDIVVDDRLYPGAANDLLEILHGLGNKWDRVMLVGHHPALSKLAHRFSSDITHMPTCAVAQFTFKAKKWQDVREATLAEAKFDRPKKP